MVYALVQGVSRLSAFRDDFGRQLGITPSQFAVLMSVAHCQGSSGVTIRALADHAAMAATHVTTEVGKLMRRGLLKKKASPSDRRSVLVSLTSQGQAGIDSLVPFVRDINDILFKDLDAATMNVVYEFSRRLMINAESASAEVRKRKLEGDDRPRRGAVRASPAMQNVVEAKRRVQGRL
jgi:DNA-binding MarR family transcriptional regulator